jgi:hypothetical protein
MTTYRFQIAIIVPTFTVRLTVRLVLGYRRLRYGYPFRRIMLGKGYYAIVDPEDYDRLIEYKWYKVNCDGIFYASNIEKINGRMVNRKMHRLVLQKQLREAQKGTRVKLVVDHINHNGLDNRKANLRIVTPRQNSWNRRYKNKAACSSRFMGVSWRKCMSKWQARITVRGKTLFLGYFDNQIDAAKAYDRAVLKYRGTYGALNFPPNA